MRKQLTFCNAATAGFPTKWRVGNKCRNSMLMMGHYPDLDSALDWLKQISCAYPDLSSDISSVWNFCAHSLDIILWGNQWWYHKMLVVFSGYVEVESLMILSIAWIFVTIHDAILYKLTQTLFFFAGTTKTCERSFPSVEQVNYQGWDPRCTIWWWRRTARRYILNVNNLIYWLINFWFNSLVRLTFLLPLNSVYIIVHENPWGEWITW